MNRHPVALPPITQYLPLELRTEIADNALVLHRGVKKLHSKWYQFSQESALDVVTQLYIWCALNGVRP